MSFQNERDGEDEIVDFRSVSYTVGSTRVLHDLDLSVEKGETVVLLGESGCGKTTTLRLINRLIEPTSGMVLVFGRPTGEWDAIELRRRIGYVLQDGGLFPHMTVEQNIAVVLKLLGEREDRERVNKMLSLVGLETARFAERFPHELSGGQRQRVGVARALVADPGLLLLDEPFGALDALTRTKLQKEFAKLVRELGKTAIFVTHDLHEAMLLGSRIVLMDKGRIVLDETPQSFAASTQPLARSYLETITA